MADNQGDAAVHRSIDKSGVFVPVVAIDVGGAGAESLWTGAGGGGGSGTEYTEDAAAVADPIGGVQILVRKDTPSATVSTDGDNIAQRGTNFGAAYVTLLDTGGSPVAVGGGTQYTEDVAAVADPIGTMLIVRRRDSLVSEVSTDGDNIAANATSKGEQYVKHVDPIPVTDNAGSLTVDGTVAVSNATFPVTDNAGSLTVDAPVGTPVFVRLSDGSAAIATLPVSLASVPSHAVTNAGTFAVQADTELPTAAALADATANPTTTVVGAMLEGWNGATWDRLKSDTTNGLDVDVTRVSGVVAVSDNAGTLTVDAPVATPVFVRLSDGTNPIATLPVSLASAPTTAVTNADITTIAGAIKAEDVASADAHPGMVILARRTATPANTSGTDLDYEVPQMNAGRLWVDPSGVTLTVASHAVTNAGTFLVQAVGNVAEDAAISGNPVLAAARAHSGVPTAMSTNNDVVIPWSDLSGALAVIPQARQVRVTATPTIATSGYVNDDQIGGLQTYTNAALASGRPGLIVGATLTSRTVTALNALELWIFEASPTLAGSDNAAFDLTDANLETARPTAVIDFLAADYRNTVSGCWCLGSVKGGKVSEPFVTSGSANLFGVLVATATPAAQYGGTTDIVVALEVQQF
jgi:hypothetical protein